MKSDRLTAFLNLGEAVYSAFSKRNPNRHPSFTAVKGIRAKAVREAVQSRLVLLLTELTNADSADPIRTTLHMPSPHDRERIVIIAALLWLKMASIYSDTNANLICQIAAVSVNGPLPVALLTARRALADLMQFKAVHISNGHVVHFTSEFAAVLTEDEHLRQMLSGNEFVMAEEATKPQQQVEPDANAIFRQFIQNLPLSRPQELNQVIAALGYVGQDAARKAICVAAYRHVRRIRAIHLNGEKRDSLPRRDCLLFIGPTGSGKTHLLELVFHRILNMPFVLWNTANMTEAGYVGSKIEHLLNRLCIAANFNIKIAEACGVIGLDEIDKIAAVGTGTGMTPGERNSRDVSGDGVQRVLLKILEGGTLSVPNYNRDCGAWEFNAQDTLIIGAGAFSALRQHRPQVGPMGFGAQSGSVTQPQQFCSDDFVRYGFSPEFIGRFSATVFLDELSRDDLTAILRQNVIAAYAKELLFEGVTLRVDEAVIRHSVDEALERKTGARGLAACLSDIFRDCFYDLYSSQASVRGISLFMDDGKIGYEISRSRPLSGQAHDGKTSNNCFVNNLGANQ